MSYSFRIGGDRMRNYSMTVDDRTHDIIGRQLFIPSLAVVQQVLSPDGDTDWISGMAMSRWLKPKKGTQEKKIWVYYPDIFSLIRALHHGVESYERVQSGTLPVLRRAIQQSVLVQAALLSLRKDNAQKRMPMLVREVNKLLSGLTLGRGDADIYKAEMQLIRVELGEDRLNKVNAPALLPRLINARRSLLHVETERTGKNADFHRRRSTLLSTLAALEYSIRCAKEACGQLVEQRESIEREEHIRSFACDMLLSFAFLFDSIDINPYAVTAQYAANEFRRAAQLITEGFYDDGYKVLATSEASFELRSIRTDLERVLFRISRIVHLHHRKVMPTPLKEDVMRLESAIEMIAGLNTAGMEDFDAVAIEGQIQSISRAYKHRLFKDAYEQLKLVVSRI